MAQPVSEAACKAAKAAGRTQEQTMQAATASAGRAASNPATAAGQPPEKVAAMAGEEACATGEDRVKLKFGYMQEKESEQCTFLPGESWMARDLSELKACSSSTMIGLQAYRLGDPDLADGVVNSRAKEKKVLVEHSVSTEATRTRESLKALAAAGIEVNTTAGADPSTLHGQKLEGNNIQHVKGPSIISSDCPPKAWLGSRNHTKAAQFNIEIMIEFQN